MSKKFKVVHNRSQEASSPGNLGSIYIGYVPRVIIQRNKEIFDVHADSMMLWQ